MTTEIIVSIIGPDRAGVLADLARQTHELEGKWLDSRISQLDGQLTGLIKIVLPEANLKALVSAFAQHTDLQMQFNAPNKDVQRAEPIAMRYLCEDRPGIVNDISHALHEIGVYIDSMSCQRLSVMTIGGTVFSADLMICLPDNLDKEAVTDKLTSLDEKASIEFDD